MRWAIVSILAVVSQAAMAGATSQPATPVLEMRLAETGWGTASLADVRAVLTSAGRQLLVHVPGAKLETLDVRPDGGPIALFKRAADGAIIIKLNTHDTYWAQYAFQFGHELCHVLCRFDEGDRGNLWFEESICEVASLYVLRCMADEWQTRPPYPNWRSFAPKLAEYADTRLAERELPAGKTLAEWYQEESVSLRADPVNRDRNRIVAGALLGLFEKSPEHWAAVAYLNQGKVKGPMPFEAYLQNWQDRTPIRHRAFIHAIAGKFGIELQPADQTEKERSPGN
jgi:hypothetical protein